MTPAASLAASPAMDFLPDHLVDHLRRVVDQPCLDGTRYTIERELGRGGLGVVWAVRDHDLDRTVALKVMDSHDDGLLAEARTAARLEHPGVVPIHEAGRLPDGRAFYVMKLVEGERLDRHAASAGLRERLRLFLKICEAVAFAHSRGVIHRDLKPQNVMVGRFGEVFVMDWGLPGCGTPGYMAPEQMAGGIVDARADIHALGAVLRDLIGPGGPRPLAAIAARARHPDPAARYDSVQALAEEVTRYLDHESVQAYQETARERVRRFVERNPVLLLLLAAYVIVRFTLFFLQRR